MLHINRETKSRRFLLQLRKSTTKHTASNCAVSCTKAIKSEIEIANATRVYIEVPIYPNNGVVVLKLEYTHTHFYSTCMCRVYTFVLVMSRFHTQMTRSFYAYKPKLSKRLKKIVNLLLMRGSPCKLVHHKRNPGNRTKYVPEQVDLCYTVEVIKR